jgi:hypothetical protein
MRTPKEEFDLNLKRVGNLLNIFDRENAKKKEEVQSSPDEKEQVEIEQQDLLRASVVFLHASFENYFRTVIIDYLKTNKQNTNVKLPEMGLPNAENPRTEKFYISQLLPYLGKNVNSLVDEAIENHMNKISFNNFNDICTWTNTMRIDLRTFKAVDGYSEKLEKLIKRRHKIVHEADKSSGSNTENEDEKTRAARIQKGSVDTWIKVVACLVNCIGNEIRSKSAEFIGNV